MWSDNSERLYPSVQVHLDYTQDAFPYDSEGGGPTCTICYRIILMAAPGESFVGDGASAGRPLRHRGLAKVAADWKPPCAFVTIPGSRVAAGAGEMKGIEYIDILRVLIYALTRLLVLSA